MDSCDISTPVSTSHKTIHLILSQNFSGGVNLIWDNYMGLPFSGYIIYRGKSVANMIPFDTVSSNINLFTTLDNIMPYYQVRINLLKICSASSLKYEVGPYPQSLSNIAEYKNAAITAQSGEFISLYPNPATDFVRIIKKDEYENINVQIMDLSGQMLIEKTLTGEQLDIQSLLPGIYILKVDGVVFKLIKQ
jgi:hypothetical protein